MPWTEDDVAAHNKHAASDEHLRHKWVTVANSALEEYGDDAKAIRIANASVDDPAKRSGSRRPKWKWSK